MVLRVSHPCDGDDDGAAWPCSGETDTASKSAPEENEVTDLESSAKKVEEAEAVYRQRARICGGRGPGTIWKVEEAEAVIRERTWVCRDGGYGAGLSVVKRRQRPCTVGGHGSAEVADLGKWNRQRPCTVGGHGSAEVADLGSGRGRGRVPSEGTDLCGGRGPRTHVA
ncbi:hypothetical protein AAVH_25793 [Aphelenchoides avenae]|nr:hypothetical protein AAVH_25793 [Aphelenchus avenae]